MKKLNSFQRAKIKEVLLKARTMNEDDLAKLRSSISVSDGSIDVREIILEGIDSILNRDQLTNIATIPEADIKLGET